LSVLAVLSWGRIVRGAGLSVAVAAVAVLLVVRERRIAVVMTALFATAAAPIGWNAILRATHASNFFTDAPVAVFPASWQDFGSGVFTLAAAALLLGVGPLGKATGRRVVVLASACALAAFLVDIYLY
jgi:hypothetical protein